MQLPEAFVDYTRRLFGEKLFAQYLDAFNHPAPVSIRLNPFKSPRVQEFKTLLPVTLESSVPWCRYGYYLSERPDFITDPRLHAGCYYVQEASSMFWLRLWSNTYRGMFVCLICVQHLVGRALVPEAS